MNTDPLLGPLSNNSGTTMTLALLPGSPAINAGTNAGIPATDQRGIFRDYGTAADIGAYEFVDSGPVRIAGPTPVYYPTIQFGYDATSTGNTLEALAADFPENLFFDRAVNVVFSGGYDAGFLTPGPATTVIGQVVISAGGVTINNLMIR